MKIPSPVRYIGSTLMLLATALTNSVRAEVLPADSNVVDISLAPYNASGSDSADDTAAIRQAISDNVGKGKIIYFPNGTYIVSDSLEWKETVVVNGVTQRQWRANLFFQGESRAGTILKLADNVPAFQKGTSPQPRAIIKTGGTFNNLPVVDIRPDGTIPSGGGNEAFRNSIYDMTIDAGSGNNNAIGVDWAVSNRGVIRNVTIRSIAAGRVGSSGILMTRDVGPGLIQDVTIDGFDVGIQGGSQQYSTTIQKLTLTNQNKIGIDLVSAAYFIENLTSSVSSSNISPAIRVGSASGYLCLVNAVFTRAGTASGASAIEDATGTTSNPPDAHYLIRNVTATGYASALKVDGVVQAGNSIAERASQQPPFTLFSTPAATLGLPISEPPAVYYTNPNAVPSDWANVNTFPNGPISARAGDSVDDTPAIQAAMNSGKPIIYFPKGPNFVDSYLLRNTVTIPPSVKRIIGGENFIKEVAGAFPAGAPMFRVTGGSGSDSTTFERTWFGSRADRSPIIEHASARTLYIRDIQFGGADSQGRVSLGIRNTPGCGKLYLDDVVGRIQLDHPGETWARQLNTESVDGGIVNNGGKLWVLGVKTEYDFTVIRTTSGGSTEMLGGFIMAGVATGSGHPIRDGFINENSDVSLSYMTWTSAPGDDLAVHVRETRGAQVSTLLHDDVMFSAGLSGNTSRAWVPLYVGRSKAATKEALLVVGNVTTLSPIDAAMKSRLETNLQYGVTLVRDADATASSTAGLDLVVVTPSCGTVALGTKFRDVAVPVVNSKPNYANMNMSTVSQFTNTTQSAVSIVANTHPLAGGLSTGTFTVLTTPEVFSIGRASSTGVNVANIPGAPTQWPVFGYESGAVMINNFPAPARRVGFFKGTTANTLTTDGWRLFDAAVTWAGQ